ncbi:protein obstructor-E [Nilaparvata lugens]|uniref:Cuticular protein n=1 Tax=Nilaparvata lugens TaxID=108931 RepID=A0A2S1ZS46_NILLU|nr:protein obstructor-E [Nilaparvata lugens]AWK28289.1 cuticular protein [Nilaparvata lugens]
MHCASANVLAGVISLLLSSLQFISVKGQFQQPGPSPRPTGAVGCPERNGRFTVPSQCDAYIECEEGIGQQKLCPDGLLFNSKARFFSYPCQYPAEVDCEGRTGVQPAQPTADCPHQFGYYREGDANNCGKFKSCSNGVGHIFDCPEGLAFNERSLRCDWPDQVDTCNAEAFLGFTCPNVGQDNSLFNTDGYQYFRSPSNCQKYFLCINGRPRLFSCGEGQAFNDLINSCDGLENVTGCGATGGRQTSFGSPGFSPKPIIAPTPTFSPTQSFGQNAGFGQSSGFGQNSGFGSGSSGFGQSSGFGSGFRQNPVFGQSSGFGAAPQQQFSRRQRFNAPSPSSLQLRAQHGHAHAQSQRADSQAQFRNFDGLLTLGGPQRFNLFSGNTFDNNLRRN